MKHLIIIIAMLASLYAADFEHMSTENMINMRGSVPVDQQEDFRKEMQKRMKSMTQEERQEYSKKIHGMQGQGMKQAQQSMMTGKQGMKNKGMQGQGMKQGQHSMMTGKQGMNCGQGMMSNGCMHCCCCCQGMMMNKQGKGMKCGSGMMMDKQGKGMKQDQSTK